MFFLWAYVLLGQKLMETYCDEMDALSRKHAKAPGERGFCERTLMRVHVNYSREM